MNTEINKTIETCKKAINRICTTNGIDVSALMQLAKNDLILATKTLSAVVDKKINWTLGIAAENEFAMTWLYGTPSENITEELKKAESL